MRSTRSRIFIGFQAWSPRCRQVTADVARHPRRNPAWFEIERDATRRDEIRIQAVPAVPYPRRADNTAQRDHQLLQQAV